MKSYFKLYLAIGMIFFLSCEKEPTEIPREQNTKAQIIENKMLTLAPTFEQDNAILNSNVKIFRATENALLLSLTEKEMTFINDPILKEVKVGDVINSAPSTFAEAGYNVKILDIYETGDKIAFHIEPAGLSDLFAEANISFSSEKNGKENQASKSIPFTVRGQKDFPSGLFARFDVKGEIVLELDFNTNSWGVHDNYFRTKVGVRFLKDSNNPDLNIRVGAKEGDFNLYGYNNGDIYVGQIFFWVSGVYISFNNYITPQLTFDAIMDYQLSTSIDVHGEFSYTYEQTGISQSLGRWTRTSTIQTDVSRPEFSNLISGRLKLRVPRITLKSKLWGQNWFQIYGSAANVYKLQLDLSADYYVKGTKYYEFRAGVKGEFFKGTQNEVSYNAFLEINSNEEFMGQWFQNPNYGDGSTPGLGTGQRNRSLRSHHGKYISSENGNGFANANRNVVGDWEKFDLQYNSSDGTYSLKSNNNRYLDVDRGSGGRIIANGNRNDPDSKFFIKDVGYGWYSIKSFSTGKYLSASPSGYLIADQNSGGAWQNFRLSINNTPPPSDNWKTILNPNEALYRGQKRFSNNGGYFLSYQEDGNLVLYRVGGGAVWSSGTWKPRPWDAGKAIMQGDGNFVVYTNRGIAVWHTHTYGMPGSYLQISDEGKIRVIRSGNVLWSS